MVCTQRLVADVLSEVNMELAGAFLDERQLGAADDLLVLLDVGRGAPAAGVGQQPCLAEARQAREEHRAQELRLPREVVVDREEPGERDGPRRLGEDWKLRLCSRRSLHHHPALALGAGAEELHVVVLVYVGPEVRRDDEPELGPRHLLLRHRRPRRRRRSLRARGLGLEQAAGVREADALLERFLDLLLQVRHAPASAPGRAEDLLPDAE
mmetsp:Transcript_109564/g.309988  ORF Transcript_109564/g.309988 Transcript_109564/m.309988 type:complete len:211 (+) Transcript_109564:157-789(+)